MKLFDWRRGRGLSQADLARLVGAAQPTIAKYEGGRLIPRPEIMARITAVTDGAVTANDFYAREAAE